MRFRRRIRVPADRSAYAPPASAGTTKRLFRPSRFIRLSTRTMDRSARSDPFPEPGRRTSMPYTVQIPSYPDGSDILRGIPYKCCSGSDFFLIPRMRRVRARSGHILMKVFSLLSSLENVAVFNESRTTNSTHFLCRSWTGHRFCPVLPYLFRCGVSRRLFDSGPATTF